MTSPPRSGLSSAASSRLHDALAEDDFIEQPERLLAYESDALTTHRGEPLAALFPRSAEQVQQVVRILYEERVPFVPRGAGTGLSGGAVADGAVLVSTARMGRILSMEPGARRAVVEPGVVTARISEAAHPHGLRYLPDPASATACTIGGNVAENSGGPHCLLHGVTTDHVLGLEVVLPTGERLRLGRGEDGGLDLAGLFIGSEGTLGLAVSVTVRLAPIREEVRTALAIFGDVASAGEAVTRIVASDLLPVALELIDHRTIRVVEESGFAAGIPTDAGAALIIECEGFREEAGHALEAACEAAREAGAREIRTAREEEERAQLWLARKKAFGALGRMAPDILIQDAVVPRTALPHLLPRIEEIAEEHDVPLANFFHAGDGNLHPNLLFDRRDPEQVQRVEAASSEIMRLCVEAGGTISGEHGVGLDKRRYMGLVFGDGELETLRRLKRVFDPEGLCNAGKLLPPERDPTAAPAGAGGAGGAGGSRA